MGYTHEVMSAVLVTGGSGRAMLGPKDQTFKVTELDGGALLLEPSRVLTEIEPAALQTPGLINQVKAALHRSEWIRGLNPPASSRHLAT